MDTLLGIVGLVAGIVSVILAIVAIWQALHFYSQGKGTETRVETALSSIKAQVDTLQALNARTLDRLTKYATTHREDSSFQAAQALSTALRELPAVFLQLKIPAQDSTQAVQRREIVNCYICLWYYTASANANASYSLPSVSEFDENNSYHVYIKNTIDRSFADFKHISSLINDLALDEIKASPLLHLYNDVRQNFIPFIGDTAHYFSRQSKNG